MPGPCRFEDDSEQAQLAPLAAELGSPTMRISGLMESIEAVRR